ncbi:MAG TPA: hypothetical protein VL202_11190 [Pararhizobium sp.]|uniref:acyltransferase n=1 Tax=Pararhizobium sp. TaxID=1977563 RepID=UPI002BE70AC6|nr:hypothetical protein [Pararhizobium sp.]HTO31726.1 hypothetical protein [Pararhizobium sp.]
MNVFERIGSFFRSLPKIRFHYPFATMIDRGQNNTVDAKGRLIATIRLFGTGHSIELPRSSSFTGHITIRGRGNRLVIGENCRLCGEFMIKGTDQTVSIGEGTTFESVYVLSQERGNVTVGRWCMFSRGIEIRTSDAHSLIRKSDGRRLNRPKSVVVGDHVWVGVGSILNKGTVLPDDCVVGAKSFVNKTFKESGVVLAGTPAVVVKRGITWNRRRFRLFSKEEMEEWRTSEPINDDDD